MLEKSLMEDELALQRYLRGNGYQNEVLIEYLWSDARAAWNFLSLKDFIRTRVNKTKDFYSVTDI